MPKKIALILAGGSVLSEKDLVAVFEEKDLNKWLSKMPELLIMADIEPIFLLGEKQTDGGPIFWQKLNDLLHVSWEKYDGFIITSQMEQILYNALATSFAFANINKPVIFTGAQMPIINKSLVAVKKSFGGLGVKANLINAVQLSTMNFPAVGMMFGNLFLRAVKAERTAVYALNIFTSFDNSYLAKIDFGISPQQKLFLPEKELKFQNGFVGEILSLKYYPGLKVEQVLKSTDGVKGIFMESEPLDELNRKFIDGLVQSGLPVVIYNKFFAPDFEDADNIISLFDTTRETAMVKFMWALAQTDKPEEIREIMLKEYCNEFRHIKGR